MIYKECSYLEATLPTRHFTMPNPKVYNSLPRGEACVTCRSLKIVRMSFRRLYTAFFLAFFFCSSSAVMGPNPSVDHATSREENVPTATQVSLQTV